MKRIALALTALALGGLAFAEDAPAAKISGYFDSGLYIFNNEDGTKFQSFADDYNTANTGYVGVLTATLATDKFGYVLGVELAQKGPDVDTAFVWVSPVTNFKLYAGTGSDVLNDLDDNDTKLFKNADGLAAVYSVNGFTLGANVSADKDARTEGAQYTFGAGYVVDKSFALNFDATTTADGKKIDAYIASASVSAVPSLSLTAGYNASAVSTDAATFFDVSASYAINDTVSVGLLLYDYLANNTSGAYGKNGITSNLGNSIYYVPSVTYAVSKDVSLTGSFYGDSAADHNYSGRLAASYTPVAGSTLSASVEYDTNPDHLTSAKSQTVFNFQFLTSF